MQITAPLIADEAVAARARDELELAALAIDERAAKLAEIAHS